MATANYKVSTTRVANAVAEHESARMVSSDGSRTAIGRYVKCAGPNRTYTIVQAWTLRERGADGKLKIVYSGRSKEAAIEWVA